jgi:NAD(P)-dependent dehydrogenase (short-subunit alcohol dehydrogenase family)
VVDTHRDAYGRCDVLVNNAGVGMGELVESLTTKKLDIQLNTNFRSIPLFYREAMDMLKAAGEEHRNALVVNTSSISGKRGEAWLSVYSGTKHAVIGFTQAMNKELNNAGIKSTALAPAFVDTPMTDFVKEQVPAESMITTADIAESVRFLLKLSPGCVVPEIQFEQPGGGPLANV